MIKEFNIKQLDNVMEIWLETNIEAHDFIKKEYWKSNFEFVKKILPSADVYVSEEDNVIKGFIGVMDGSYVAGLFVKKEYQGHGIGHELIDYCKSKYKNLTLDVFLKNENALRFYKKNGFKVIDKKVNEDTEELEYTMKYEL